MIGFDAGFESERVLDGENVREINSNLTASVDVTRARGLASNTGICFRSTEKGGAFELSFEEGAELLRAPNPHGKCTSDVVRPWANAVNTIQRRTDMWILDFFGVRDQSEAALYEAAYGVLRERVMPERQRNSSENLRRQWWLFRRAGTDMRAGISGLPRYLATPATAKHRVFLWLDAVVLADHQVHVFARSDDYFFGVLHSRAHEVWARAQGTQLRERESGFRYTPTTCFETFPLLEPTKEQREAIAAAAKELDELRNRWLNPPEWTREEVLEFAGSIGGPWARYVVNADARGIGTVRYPRIVARDEETAKRLAKRTLTNLYNERPAWLEMAHRKLDEAVYGAYGWEGDVSDEEVVRRLLEINLERAGRERAGRAVGT
jgi:hypothetical protein